MIDGCDRVTFWSPVYNSSLFYAHFMSLGQGLATRIVRFNTVGIIQDGMRGVWPGNKQFDRGTKVIFPFVEYLIQLITQP